MLRSAVIRITAQARGGCELAVTQHERAIEKQTLQLDPIWVWVKTKSPGDAEMSACCHLPAGFHTHPHMFVAFGVNRLCSHGALASCRLSRESPQTQPRNQTTKTEKKKVAEAQNQAPSPGTASKMAFGPLERPVRVRACVLLRDSGSG